MATRKPMPGKRYYTVSEANATLPLVGVLMPFKQDDDETRARLAAVRKGLAESGFTEGKTYSLAMRFGDGSRPTPALQGAPATSRRQV